MEDYLISRFNSFSLDTQGLSPDNLAERTKKEFAYREGSTTLLICLPNWGQPLKINNRVKKYTLESGVSFLAYDFPSPILSQDRNLTRDCFMRINEIIRKEITDLRNTYHFEKVHLVAPSLASSYGSMIYENNPEITHITLVAPGENLARDMWYGCRTQHLRQAYERQGITLQQLEEAWDELDSENHKPARGTKVTLYLGTKDKVIPYIYSKKLIEILGPERVREYPWGHYGLIGRFLLNPSHFLELS